MDARLARGELALIDVDRWGQAAWLRGDDVPGAWRAGQVIWLQWGTSYRGTAMLLGPDVSLACLLDRIVDVVLIVVLLVRLSRHVHLLLDGQDQRLGHRGHVQLRVEVRQRLAVVVVDDQVVLDGGQVGDKVVRLLHLETLVADLVDVSWERRPQICGQRRLLGDLEDQNFVWGKSKYCRSGVKTMKRLTLSTCGGKSCLCEDGTQSPS